MRKGFKYFLILMIAALLVMAIAPVIPQLFLMK